MKLNRFIICEPKSRWGFRIYVFEVDVENPDHFYEALATIRGAWSEHYNIRVDDEDWKPQGHSFWPFARITEVTLTRD